MHNKPLNKILNWIVYLITYSNMLGFSHTGRLKSQNENCANAHWRFFIFPSVEDAAADIKCRYHSVKHNLGASVSHLCMFTSANSCYLMLNWLHDYEILENKMDK